MTQEPPDVDPTDEEPDEGDLGSASAAPEIPDEPDETEGEAWMAEKDVTPDMSADDPVAEIDGSGFEPVTEANRP